MAMPRTECPVSAERLAHKEQERTAAQYRLAAGGSQRLGRHRYSNLRRYIGRPGSQGKDCPRASGARCFVTMHALLIMCASLRWVSSAMQTAGALMVTDVTLKCDRLGLVQIVV